MAALAAGLGRSCEDVRGVRELDDQEPRAPTMGAPSKTATGNPAGVRSSRDRPLEAAIGFKRRPAAWLGNAAAGLDADVRCPTGAHDRRPLKNSPTSEARVGVELVAARSEPVAEEVAGAHVPADDDPAVHSEQADDSCARPPRMPPRERRSTTEYDRFGHDALTNCRSG
jgi:hypothetical protein